MPIDPNKLPANLADETVHLIGIVEQVEDIVVNAVEGGLNPDVAASALLSLADKYNKDLVARPGIFN